MRFITPLAAFAVVITCGCASVKITPTSVVAVSGRTQEGDASLERWREAVRLCNAFLQSPHRVTLPSGSLRFKNDAMEFVIGDTVLPVRIKCTTWGDWLVRTSMAAQERSDGFVVGLVQPRRSRLLDNSFFKDGNGQPRSSDTMAELILHELTHSYYRCGTVSFPKTVGYYAEAIFLFRYRQHSMERLPYKTSEEFRTFRRRSSLRACHFQTPYLSPFLGQVTCISPNVYGPPVTLSPPVTPVGPPPKSCSCSRSEPIGPIRTNRHLRATRPPPGSVTHHPLHVTDRVTLKNASSLTVNANVTDVTDISGKPLWDPNPVAADVSPL